MTAQPIFDRQQLQIWLPAICQAAREAGREIMEIYQCLDCEVEHKADGSPVTQADKTADEMIRQALAKLTPDIPVVSEENVDSTPFEVRRQWPAFWLVDPLDGTKEFIERTGEFCVNIALVVGGESVLGVVYGPVRDVTYCAYQGGEATKAIDGRLSVLSVRHPLKPPVQVAVSRRHGKKVTEFLAGLGDYELVNMGSALKSCLVAEGQADVYPRFGPTSHWDTAASQVIVEAAGGRIINPQGQDLRYHPAESLLNPYFMVIGDTKFAWPGFPNPPASR